MSCFWDGIIQELHRKTHHRFSSPIQLIQYFKSNNVKTPSVTCRQTFLRDSQLQENYNHVMTYDQNSFRNGYFCSAFEPFLFLACKLFSVNIVHNFNNNLFSFVDTERENSITLNFTSSSTHFQAA